MSLLARRLITSAAIGGTLVTGMRSVAAMSTSRGGGKMTVEKVCLLSAVCFLLFAVCLLPAVCCCVSACLLFAGGFVSFLYGLLSALVDFCNYMHGLSPRRDDSISHTIYDCYQGS
jgi:hypothetical protein